MSEGVGALAARLTGGLAGQRERAVALHDFVRDEIAFGFTSALEAATPLQTLAARVGHGNPKGALFVALLRAAGLQARQHFVVIDREILRGVFPACGHLLVPWEISHSYTDVLVEGRWRRVDSYIVDSALWDAASARLIEEGEMLGYAVHRLGTNEWDGRADAFAQFASADMLLEDHGAFDDPSAYFASDPYRNRLGTLPLDSIFSFASDHLATRGERRLRRHLDALRTGTVRDTIRPRSTSHYS